MLSKTQFDVSGERFTVSYLISDSDAEARARHLIVEQTIEFPEHLVPDDSIREHIIGRIERLASVSDAAAVVDVSYSAESSGFTLPQLLNLIFGNISLQPGVRVAEIKLPDSMLGLFKGPRFGRDGLRERVGEAEYPIFCTALKPMGLSSSSLAAQAAEYVNGGFHIIKDDHGLADQPTAPFRERVPRILDSVNEANARNGSSTLYVPSLNSPSERLVDDAKWAVELGAGGLMLLPGISGMDTMRRFAEDDDIAVPILAHPAMMGSYVSSPVSGMAHSVIFGQLSRLAGADATIFPNFGGRFSFLESECLEIAAQTVAPMANIKANFPAPGGGMRVENVPDMVRAYGRDVMFLVGGALHDGDEGVAARCENFISSVTEAIQADDRERRFTS